MNYKLKPFICFIAALIMLPGASFPEDNVVFPDINGNWTSLAPDGKDTGAVIRIDQSGKYLEGKFTDSKDGRIIIEAPVQGYVDGQGNIIFDISFGRITSTNRLKLSPDQITMDGTFSNNAGNQGEAHYRKQ